MALQAAVAERWQKVTGTKVIEGYGLSEASPVLTCNPADARSLRRLDCRFPPQKSDVLMIMRDVGVAVGQPGEIIARGPQVMPGYWKQPSETSNVLRGWMAIHRRHRKK